MIPYAKHELVARLRGCALNYVRPDLSLEYQAANMIEELQDEHVEAVAAFKRLKRSYATTLHKSLVYVMDTLEQADPELEHPLTKESLRKLRAVDKCLNVLTRSKP